MFSGHDLTCIRGERLVFSGLSFEVGEGTALLLTGPNGSGKTSLLRLMAGLLRPAEGEFRWNGVPVADDPDGFRLALRYVGHADAIKPTQSVADDLGFWSSWRGGDDGASERHVAALHTFDLAHLAETPCRFLSAGQRRRLALARLIAAPAPLWLMDEPTVGLDRNSLAALEGAIAAHCSEGGIAIIATHQDIAVPRPAELRLEVAVAVAI